MSQQLCIRLGIHFLFVAVVTFLEELDNDDTDIYKMPQHFEGEQ
jgi:hypothetical protein